MAKNIFDATLDVDNDIKVNSFDWSHANNLTTDIGRITPVFCELVPAHSSIRISPTFGLQFMPMVFPIQTRMKARIAFFKYPLRALWKDYRDFVGNFRDGLIEPYVNINNTHRLTKMVATGSLGDYLGIPSTKVGTWGTEYSPQSVSNMYFTTVSAANTAEANVSYLSSWVGFKYARGGNNIAASAAVDGRKGAYTRLFTFNLNDDELNNTQMQIDLTIQGVDLSGSFELMDWIKRYLIISQLNGTTSTSSVIASYSVNDGTLVVTDVKVQGDTGIRVIATIPMYNTFNKTSQVLATHIPYDGIKSYPANGVFSSVAWDLNAMIGSTSANTISLVDSPYYNSDSDKCDKQIKLSAYSFRAYEGIYNSYFRDNRNNPYYIDGVVQYNQWIPTYDGGEDNNLYELRYANWEKDFLTTAVQSPLQGQAPLVGITTYQTVESQADGSTKVVNKAALVDEDGKRFALEFDSDKEGLNDVRYVELDNGTAVTQARSLIDLANSGVSIADLRNVNAYQKFLELNMRKGYSYKDVVEGRFNVKVRYSELLMPEFFGGFSRDVQMNAISQTVDQDIESNTGSYERALGSQSGIAGVRGETDQTIECFCDEESIIMGVLVVTPLPVYTQLLPKHFTYRGLLDHYQPEFNHIGFQPILYKEVAPIQAWLDNQDSLSDTFGYNRPWYEYCQKYDEAHGLFRTDMNRFLMSRIFNVKPELAQSFLLVDPNQVNNVFSVTETTDKIYGQVWFNCIARLPIARVAIPRLD